MIVSDTIKCEKDFNERNVQNFVAETEKLNSLIYLETKKDERRINGKSILGILSLKLKKGDEFKIILFNTFEEELKPELDKVLEVISDFNKKIKIK